MNSNTIVITRHPALLELLQERGLATADTMVIAHATRDDVRGKHVIGVLPLALAALAATVTEIPLAVPPEWRGRELTVGELQQIAGTPATYTVNLVTPAMIWCDPSTWSEEIKDAFIDGWVDAGGYTGDMSEDNPVSWGCPWTCPGKICVDPTGTPQDWGRAYWEACKEEVQAYLDIDDICTESDEDE